MGGANSTSRATWPLTGTTAMSKTPPLAQLRPRALADRRRALEDLVVRERPRTVARLCSSVSQADAEDLYQDACLRALERLPQQRDPARLRAWFNTVLRTVLSQKATPRALASPCSTEEHPPAATHLRPCGCGFAVLSTLSPQRQRLLQRSVLEGQPPHQLASAAATTSSHIRVQLHRARVQLRARWERKCGSCISRDHGAGCACSEARDIRAP